MTEEIRSLRGPVASGLAYVFLLPQLVLAGVASYAYARGPLGGIDFRGYWVAARIGIRYGWARIYDVNLQADQLKAVFVGIHGHPAGYWAPFVTPPPAAVLAATLAMVPFGYGWLIWSSLACVSVILAVYFLAPRSWPARLLMAVLLLATSEGLIGIVAGNIIAFVLLAVAVGIRLAVAQRYVVAGLVLGLTAVKPQVVLLLLPALLVAGYWRIAAGYVASAAALGVVSFLLLGVSGVREYQSLLKFVGSFSNQQAMTLPHALGSGVVAAAVSIAIALLTLAAAWVYRSRGVGVVSAVALIGSLLVTPYVNSEDYVLLAAGAAILVVQSRSFAERCLAGAAAASATILGAGSIAPVAVAGVAVLAGALVLSRQELFESLQGWSGHRELVAQR